ncbi:PilL protein [Xanthomonas oryzae pv. oryzae KACC 10331]|uniref:PilL protein n=1 Tax=Xanthomonas oryzae pv. oryzae (strain KACC10331 / KXO85) TaxID=291331 RepID=Q5GU84_XANOR|nr:PilL protein [Xanthomonas oryzae pv. oryzae KACC 10331]
MFRAQRGKGENGTRLGIPGRVVAPPAAQQHGRGCACSGLVRGFAVRGDVQALALGFFAHAQAEYQLGDHKPHHRHHADPADRDSDAQRLDADLMNDVVIAALLAAQRGSREHAGQDRADDAAQAMHAEHVQAVVGTEQALQTGDAPHAEHAGSQANDDRAERAHRTAGRGDADQAGHHARGHTQGGRLALDDLLGQRPAQDGGSGRQQGVEEGQRRTGIGFQIGTGVETEPAHPQQRGTDEGQGHVVRLDRLTSQPGTLADEVGANQTGDTGVDMHHGTACEIQRAQPEQIPTGGPDHVRQRQVAEGEPDRREQQHRAELGAFGKGADDQRAGNAGEGRLEHHKHVFRQAHALGEGGRQGFDGDALEQRLVQIADPRTSTGERQAVAVQHPQDDQQREHHSDLDQHRQHVLGAHHAAVEQRQARHHHEQHQQGGSQHPGDVALLHHRCGLDGSGRRGGRLRRRQRFGGDRRGRQWGDLGSGLRLRAAHATDDQRAEQHQHARAVEPGFPPGKKSCLHTNSKAGGVRAHRRRSRRCGCAPPARSR